MGKNKSLLRCSIFIGHLLLLQALSGQSYFKLITQPANGYHQRLSQFANGDILIGDKYFTDTNFSARGFFLMRIDACGEVIWANTYSANKRMSLIGITILPNEEVIVTGELINSSVNGDGYILKLSANGEAMAFKSYDTYRKEYPYSLSYHSGKLMIGGLSFNQPNTDKNYYIMIIDENLRLLSGNKYQPFDAYGESTLISDGVLYITGNKITKVNATGNVQWSKELLGISGYLTFSVPIEVADGFIFGITENGYNWFFKLDHSGNLVWQSKKILSFFHITNLITLADQTILSVYHRETINGNTPCFLILSPQGEILEQYQLNIDFPLHTGFTYLTITDDARVNLLGNANMNSLSGAHSKADFLMQFNLHQLDGGCFQWEQYHETIDDNINLQLGNISSSVSEAPFELVDERISISPLNFMISDICELEQRQQTISTDTLLNCDTDWRITLPTDSYAWQDGNQDNPRIVSIPGTYVAAFEDCGRRIVNEYRLEKEECHCQVFIPNAISPNKDGINDQLEVFSNCEITQIEMSIYNRWGDLIFTSTSLDQLWNGNHNGRRVNSGVYVLKIYMQTNDHINGLHYFERHQEITVI